MTPARYAAVILALISTTGVRLTAADPVSAGVLSQIAAVRIEAGPDGKPLSLAGRDGRLQLVVTGTTAAGGAHDLTRSVSYRLEPADVAAVDPTGLMTPLKDGETVVTVSTPAGRSAQTKVAVTGVAENLPIDFNNQIVPVFTKLNCNGGGCHGKSGGQNGFRLSLLGFYPEDDYEFLAREGRGRRIFVSAPDESLLLTKPSGRSPHGGGRRMEPDSYEYQVMRRWIEQGMPRSSGKERTVVGIRCVPDARIMAQQTEQQISVVARYSDGSTEDVTRTALYEPNDVEMAEVSVTGLMKTQKLAGEVAIMARYQGQVATFRATVPLGAKLAEKPAVRNFVDETVFAKLDVLGVPASAVCDDATFIRRVSLDITGTLPTEPQVREFLADASPDKRDRLIDRLLDSPAYADFFTNKWNMVLRNKRRGNDSLAGTYLFRDWIWNNLYENKPYDQMVRELITATGSPEQSPTVAWYREVNEANEQVEDVSQLFLGLRIQCARCHHHPFEKWSQDDYFGMAAFFSRVGRKNLEGANPQERDRSLFHIDDQGPAAARNDRTGKMLPPTGLGSPALQVTPEQDPRILLADWMAAPDNPFFAKALVNRYWKHFFSRGIVEPEDDMRETNPPTNPALLDALAKHFVTSKFDLKDLVRTICRSSTYQLSAIPNEYNVTDKQNFSRYYPKRLSAEVLYDAFHQVTATDQSYGGLPAGTKAVQLPDPSVGPYFLKVFGQPQADTACECERSQEANLAQSLHLLNSTEVQNKIAAGNARAALLANDAARAPEEKIRELYRWVYAREPAPEELQLAVDHLARQKENPKLAYEDLVWALINTKEFLFNH